MPSTRTVTINIEETVSLEDYPEGVFSSIVERLKDIEGIELMKIGEKILRSTSSGPIVSRGLKGYVLIGDLRDERIDNIRLSLHLHQNTNNKTVIIDRVYLCEESEESGPKRIWCPLPKDKIRDTKGAYTHGLVKWIPKVGLLDKWNSSVGLELTSPIHTNWGSTISTSYKALWANENCIHEYTKF